MTEKTQWLCARGWYGGWLAQAHSCCCFLWSLCPAEVFAVCAAQPAFSVIGEQGNWVGLEGECQSRTGVHSPLAALLFPCGMVSLSPPSVSPAPAGNLCGCYASALWRHGSRVAPGSNSEHWWWRGKGWLVLASLTSDLGKKGGKWVGEWILYPSIAVFSLPSLNPSFLISEMLDKVTPVMAREGELEGKGVAGGAQMQHWERRTVSNAIHWHFKALALQVMD